MCLDLRWVIGSEAGSVCPSVHAPWLESRTGLRRIVPLCTASGRSSSRSQDHRGVPFRVDAPIVVP